MLPRGVYTLPVRFSPGDAGSKRDTLRIFVSTMMQQNVEVYDIPASGEGIMGVTPEDGTSPGSPLLLHLYPNPCNGWAVIYYSLPSRETCELKIHDSGGRMIDSRLLSPSSSQTGSIVWKADDLPGGVYYFYLRGGSASATGKITLLR